MWFMCEPVTGVVEQVEAFLHTHPMVKFVDILKADRSWTFSRTMKGIRRTILTPSEVNNVWRAYLNNDVGGGSR